MLKLQLPRPAGKQPAAAQPQPERPQVPLLETDPAMGLTAEQAAQRMAAGLDNRAAASPTRSETEIIRDNIFTFFNLVFIVLALCLALVGSFANMTFLGVVIANTIIGTVQQLRSKRTVDQLTLVAAHKVRCLRDGKSILLPSEELVRDDIVEFTSGRADLCRRRCVHRQRSGERSPDYRQKQSRCPRTLAMCCGPAAFWYRAGAPCA